MGSCDAQKPLYMLTFAWMLKQAATGSTSLRITNLSALAFKLLSLIVCVSHHYTTTRTRQAWYKNKGGSTSRSIFNVKTRASYSSLCVE